MNRKDHIQAAYNHILKSEIATLAAYELAEKNPTASSDELAIAIDQLQTAKTKLESLRKQKPTIPPRPDAY